VAALTHIGRFFAGSATTALQTYDRRPIFADAAAAPQDAAVGHRVSSRLLAGAGAQQGELGIHTFAHFLQGIGDMPGIAGGGSERKSSSNGFLQTGSGAANIGVILPRQRGVFVVSQFRIKRVRGRRYLRYRVPELRAVLRGGRRDLRSQQQQHAPRCKQAPRRMAGTQREPGESATAGNVVDDIGTRGKRIAAAGVIRSPHRTARSSTFPRNPWRSRGDCPPSAGRRKPEPTRSCRTAAALRRMWAEAVHCLAERDRC